MLQVLNLSANYSNKCPAYGGILSTSALRIAARATSHANFIDLSPQEAVLALSVKASLGDQGIKTDGKNGDVKTDYPETDDSYTFLVCFKADVASRAVETAVNRYRAYLGGSYGGTQTAGGGVGLYLMTLVDPADATKTQLIVRHTGVVKRRSDSAITINYVDLPLAASAVAVPNTSGWVYIAVTFDAVTGNTKCRLLNTGQTVSAIRDPATYFLDSISRGQYLTATGQRLMHRIGGFPGIDAVPTFNDLTIPEYLFYGRALSDAEITLQYDASKRFLAQTRGIVLP